MLETIEFYSFEVSSPLTYFLPPVIEHLAYCRVDKFTSRQSSKHSITVRTPLGKPSFSASLAIPVLQDSRFLSFKVLQRFQGNHKTGVSTRVTTTSGPAKSNSKFSAFCNFIPTKYFDKYYAFTLVKKPGQFYSKKAATYTFKVKDLYLSKIGTSQCRIEVKDNGEIPKLIIDLPLGYYGPLLEFTQPIKKIIKQPFFVKSDARKLYIYAAFKSNYTFTVILANDQAIEITVRPVTIEFLSNKLIG